MKIFLQGCAGFIGMLVMRILVARDETPVGVDSFHDHYVPCFKLARFRSAHFRDCSAEGEITSEGLIVETPILEEVAL